MKNIMVKTFSFIAVIFFITAISCRKIPERLPIAPITYIPDNNFEQALIDLGLDTGPLNDSVPTANINTITTLNVSAVQMSGFSYGRIIRDLTGIENFTALEILRCSHNELTSMDLSANTKLKELYCDNNVLTSINVSNNFELTKIDCDFNQLPSLDLSNNVALISLACSYNRLTSLDICSCAQVESLGCGYNLLTSLSVNNGNNTNFTSFFANYNLNLTCIQVDNAAWSTANWPNKDVSASYSEDCGYTF